MNEPGGGEDGLTEEERPDYQLELYMIGTTPSSSRAVVNVRKLCEEYLHGRYDLKVIDVSKDREAAKREQIIAAPTLIVRAPIQRRFIGDMSNRRSLIEGLNL